MRASDSEFANRFWTIGLVFFVGFSMAFLDPASVQGELARRLSGASEGARFDAWVIAISWTGAALTVLGALVRTWAAAYLAVDVIHDTKLRSESLVADGPYRRVRNPLYLGLMLLAAGYGLFATRLGFVVIVVGMWILVRRLIGREEAVLAAAQGERFESYRRAVPRLVPALTPRLSASGRAPNWSEALRGEAFFWVFALAAIALCATRNQLVFAAVVVVGMIAHFAVSARKQRRASDAP